MRWILVCAAAMLLGLAIVPAALAAGEQVTVTQTLALGGYELRPAANGDELFVPGLGNLLVPGKPKLPARIYALAIPPGASVVNVESDPGPGILLPGTYKIVPAPLPRVISQEDPLLAAREQQRYEDNLNAVYGSDDAYPARMVEFVRTAGYRKYDLVDVRVTPFEYRPLSGQVTYYPAVTIHVRCTLPDRPAAAIIDNLPRTERIAEELILNYQEAQKWYAPSRPAARGLYDYVIITLDSLVLTVTPLVDWETSKGRTVYVTTTAWINFSYTGYDLAEKIRNFLREKYPSGQWGIEDVLLVGHYDNVPMRRTAQDLGYGRPETDYYYAELSLPDDQSWDDDMDRQWGEDTDPIDFYNEVNVGRIPWSDATNVANICNKSVAYEQNEDPTFKKNILLLGAFFWDDDPNPRTDNAVLMEAKVNQPWMSDWTKTRMYEQGYSTYPMDYNLTWTNVKNVWSAGKYAFVNWAGHGSPTSAHVYHGGQPAFADTSTCTYLNDNYPAIIFADACSNSDTDYTNLGQAMLQKGGVGFVGATKVALGQPGWDDVMDGSSQSLDYYFTTYVTSGDYTQGAAHQQALRNMYTYGLWGYVRYETFEWGALWGNPNLGMGSAPALGINLPGGTPTELEPGVLTTFTVEIINRRENYVPGTGCLHYRYDGGTYHTSPLTYDTGNLYWAALPPAECEDTPEFYVSAQGDGGTTVFNPSNAPAAVYTAIVGTVTTILADDLQTVSGWIAGDPGDTATTGMWDHGDPEGTEAQPEDDHTPSPGTHCFVTGWQSGGSLGANDVDGGKTTLYSPLLDLSSYERVTISYWRWYSNDTGSSPNADTFVVDITNNGGTSWTNVETVGPSGAGTSGGWYYHEFNAADLVPLTSQIRLRFVASDLDSGSLIEAAIDDFLVEAFTCEMPFGPGDLNCDGAVDFADINPFVLALSGQAGYEAAYPDCNWLNGDCNDDGTVNFADINLFVAILSGK